MIRREKGFTLIEIMLVVIMIGIIAALVIPKFTGMSQEARMNRVEADIQSIKTALGMFELRHGRYPMREDGGLAALVERPPTVPEERWKQCLEEIPKDPWDSDYIYLTEDERIDDKKNYNLYSRGPNKTDDGWSGDDLPERVER